MEFHGNDAQWMVEVEQETGVGKAFWVRLDLGVPRFVHLHGHRFSTQRGEEVARLHELGAEVHATTAVDDDRVARLQLLEVGHALHQHAGGGVRGEVEGRGVLDDLHHERAVAARRAVLQRIAAQGQVETPVGCGLRAGDEQLFWFVVPMGLKPEQPVDRARVVVRVEHPPEHVEDAVRSDHGRRHVDDDHRFGLHRDVHQAGVAGVPTVAGRERVGDVVRHHDTDVVVARPHRVGRPLQGGVAVDQRLGRAQRGVGAVPVEEPLDGGTFEVGAIGDVRDVRAQVDGVPDEHLDALQFGGHDDFRFNPPIQRNAGWRPLRTVRIDEGVVRPTFGRKGLEIGEQLDFIHASGEDGGRGHVEREFTRARVQATKGQVHGTFGGGHQDGQG